MLLDLKSVTRINWCIRKQKELLKAANTPGGKYLLAKMTDGLPIVGEIIKIDPNGYHVYKGIQDETILVEAHFFSGDYVMGLLMPVIDILDIAKEYKPIDNFTQAFHHYANLERNRKYPEIFLLTSTFNPGAGDGTIRGHDGSGNWNNVRNIIDTGNPGGSTVEATAGTATTTIIYAGESDRQYLYRGLFPFATSLPSNATITSSGTKLRIYVTSAASPDAMTIGLVQTTQASISSMATTDYHAMTINSPTEGATRLTMSTLSTNAYNEWLANSNLVSWISLSGNTKLALRTSGDIDNVAPTNDTDNGISGNFSEAASNKPELVVAYTLPLNQRIVSINQAVNRSNTY